MKLLSAPVAPLDVITRAQLEFVDVSRYGAVPNDPSKAAVNDAAFASALADGRTVYVGPGTWWVSFEIYLPDSVHFKGAGMGKTIIKMVNGSAQGLNVVTNQHNDRQVRANYNRDIRISDMTIDRNAETSVEGSGGMAAGGSGGCCVALSMVKDCVIERVYTRGGVWNNVDIAAARYVSVDTTTYAEGPSINVVVRDCVAVDPWMDDAFTCHFSRLVKFINCRAEISDGQYCHWNTNGFEIDEGSIDCSATDCYAYRFSKGFQAKGHSNTPGDIRTVFTRCTAEGCGLSFAVESTNLTGRDLRIVDCSSLSPTFYGIHTTAEGPRSSTPGTGHWTEARGLEVKNRDGVTVERFIIDGGNSASGNNIVLQDGKNYTLDDCRISNVPVNRTTGMDSTRGFIQLWGDTSENFVVRNVLCRSALTYRLIRNAINNPGTPIIVEDIVAVGAAASDACVMEWTYGITKIKNVVAPGYAGGTEAPGPWVPLTSFAANFEAYGGGYFAPAYRIEGDTVKLRGLIRTTVARAAGSDIPLLTIPAIARPLSHDLQLGMSSAADSGTTGAASTGTAHTHPITLSRQIGTRIRIDSNGTLSITISSMAISNNGFISLSSISWDLV